MKRITQWIALLLAMVTALSMPASAYATSTSKSILTSLTYTHQSQHDGKTITEGIDVSYHNGAIDFQKVKNAGVKYVIMRVGYRGYSQAGNIKGDTKFETYIKDAHAAGLDIGAYFYSQAVTEAEARAEADFVINALKPYKSYVTMPVAFDYEFAEVSTGRLDSAWNNGTLNKTKMTNNTIAFCDRIKSAGYTPMVYANKSFFSEQLDHTKLEKNYVIWMANYVTKTTYSGVFDIWQYSAKGSVNGVSSTYVDCNFMYGDGKLDPSPDVITGLKATAVTSNSIAVSWTPYTGAAGYQVWIKLPGGWKNCGLTKETQYTFTDLTSGFTHEISVRAYVTVDGKDYYGKYGEYLKVRTPDKIPVVDPSFTGWKQSEGDWYYFVSGKAVNTCWRLINDVWYYFDTDSTMHTGWLHLDDVHYYLMPSGAMLHDTWKWDGGYWYYFMGNGAMRTQWLKDDKTNAWYYLGDNGRMVTGFHDVKEKRYYFNTQGAMQLGWIDAEGKRYFAMADGSLVRYSQIIKGEHYYFTGDYNMFTGWLKMSGNWYYFAEDGRRKTGWVKVKNVYYLLDEDGVMQTGWVNDAGVDYYLTDSGAMATGWCRIDGTWYYFNASGVKAVGWRYIDKKWYYFREDGTMVRYRQTIDGKQYYFTGSGDMYYGWLKISGKWYYFGAGGAMVTGKQTINGTAYTFDDNGVWQG